MNIAVDYDNTFSADPPMWRRVIELIEECGHTVWIISCRRNTFENIDELREAVGMPSVPIILTHLVGKQYHSQRLGLKIQVWIDDDPRSIIFGH